MKKDRPETFQNARLREIREGAVGIELDYVVREKGLERITGFPKELIVL